MSKPKLIRITTVPLSLDKLLSGQLNFMQSHYEVVAVSSEKDYLERVGIKENVRTFHLEMSRKITPLKDLLAVLKLFLFLIKEKPLIVHTHTPKAGIVGMIASKMAFVPHRFHTVAGMPLMEVQGVKRKILDFVEKVTYLCATKVYPNSFGLKDIILENNFCKENKLKVLANGSSNGIDTTYFSKLLFSFESTVALKKKLGITQEDFVFVFVGRLVRDKGINEMVTAFEALQKEEGRIKLLLVGNYESDLDPLFPETIKKIETNTAIISVGFQNDVRSYLSISNVLVFPSYREGFPNVVMQAGSMGLPAIVSDINGCNEIIINNKNGLIIPVKDQQAICNAMRILQSDISLYTTLTANSRSRIVEFYEQKVVWEALLKEYDTVLNSD